MPEPRCAYSFLATMFAVLAITGLQGAPQQVEGCDPTISLPDVFLGDG